MTKTGKIILISVLSVVMVAAIGTTVALTSSIEADNVAVAAEANPNLVYGMSTEGWTAHNTYFGTKEAHTHTKGTPLTSDGGDLKAGYYYLTADAKLSADIVITGNVAICLNGFKLTGTGNSSVISNGDKNYSIYILDCCAGSTCGNAAHKHAFRKDETGLYDFTGSGSGYIYGGVITGGGGYKRSSTNTTTYGGGIYGYYTYAWKYYPKAYVYGGTIAGNHATNGGGAYYVECMYGGNICGNTADNYCGGVSKLDYMYGGSISDNTSKDSNGGARLDHMYGGTISYNTAKYNIGGAGIDYMHGGTISYNTAGTYGGGAYIYERMYDGTISHNTAGTYGGGACFSSSDIIYDGTIAHNTAGTYGGGAYFSYNVSVYGGTITNNTAGICGGGVYYDNYYNYYKYHYYLRMRGNPYIYGNSTSDGKQSNLYLTARYSNWDYYNEPIHIDGDLTNAKVGIAFEQERLTYSYYRNQLTEGYSEYNSVHPSTYFISDEGYEIYQNPNGEAYINQHWHDDVQYSRSQNVIASSGTQTFTSGSYFLEDSYDNLNLVINGNVNLCLYGYTLTGSGNATITVKSGATLTLCDCYGAYDGRISSYWGNVTGANIGVQVLAGGTLVMQPSVAVSGTNYGVHNAGNISVNGCSIVGSIAGVYNTGTATLTGVAIADSDVGINNLGQATFINGVIDVTSTGVQVDANTTFTMQGGVIRNATTGINNQGTTVMDGGSIYSCNVAVNHVGTQFSISRNPIIRLNETNVYLASNKHITISGLLLPSTSVGVYMEDGVGVFTDGFSVLNSGFSPDSYFLSDDHKTVRLSSDKTEVGCFDLHYHGEQEFLAVNSVSDLSLSVDGYYTLASDIAGNVVIDGAMTLCLNGYSVSGTLTVNAGANLTLCDCNMKGAINSVVNSGTIDVSDITGIGTFTLQSGLATVIDSTLTAVSVGSGATLTLTGDAVATSIISSGNVLLGGNAQLINTSGTALTVNAGTVTVQGGNVSGKVGAQVVGGALTVSAGSISGTDCGVNVGAAGRLTLSGNGSVNSITSSGILSIGGNAQVTGNTTGASVTVNGGSLTMIGGSIGGSEVGVKVTSGAFTMNAGSITGSVTGVQVDGGMFAMSGGSVHGGTDGVTKSGAGITILLGGEVSSDSSNDTDI